MTKKEVLRLLLEVLENQYTSNPSIDEIRDHIERMVFEELIIDPDLEE